MNQMKRKMKTATSIFEQQSIMTRDGEDYEQISSPEAFVVVEDVDDDQNGIKYWEFVTGSDFEGYRNNNRSVAAADNLSDLHSLDLSWSTWYWDLSSSVAPISVSPTHQEIVGFRSCTDDVNHDENNTIDVNFYYHDQEDDAVDDQEEDDGDDGLDDELVPRHLSGKLGRNRMRKLGKKLSTKMINSAKRNPLGSVKGGCVRGKHGLGVKAGY